LTKYQVSNADRGCRFLNSPKTIREINHHRALSKRKFSFQYPLGLGAYSHRIIEPVTRNPDDFIPAQHDRAFGPFGSGYFVINKKFY